MAHASDGFVHLRTRSAYSLLEGAIKAEALGPLARGAGMPAVALTDRANLFGALEFSVATAQAGVQPIMGCALPVTGIGEGPPQRWARVPTLVLLAQDEAGWRNLTELSSAAFLEAAATDEPSVPWAKVARHAQGLILLSGGMDGPVDPLFAAGRSQEAVAAMAEMRRVFDDRFYVELQRHGQAAEAAAEPGLVAFAYEHEVPLVATNDVYFETAATHRAHDALICIADAAFLGQDDRRRVSPEHWFKSPEEMRRLFADLPEACDNTLEIARRCAFMAMKRDPILPRFPTAAGRSEDEEIAAQAREGLKGRLAVHPHFAPEADYWARLERELAVIQAMGFSGYLLIVSDFMKYAAANRIPVGPGRGSAVGSVVAWSLLITGLDPMRFNLLFERFLDPARVSMPDIDTDFCQERRDEVIAYVQAKYGRDRVAQIITFGTLQARAVLRDVGRVLQLPLGLVDRLAKMVPNNPASPVTLARAIEIEPRLRQARRDEDGVSELLDISLQLEGLYRNASTHAAGIVIGDRPLTELVPLYRDPRSDIPATQFNMKWVESAGPVKFDFLGLKTLTVVDRAVRYLGQRGAAPDTANLPLDDQAVYDLLSAGQTVGVFQLEGQGMRDTLRKLRPTSIEDITALGALYRPGPMENIDAFCDGKAGRKPIKWPHPWLEPVLAETYGIIVYQEQVMQIAQILAGYTLGEADLLRRAMGKKKKEEMALQRARFMAGAEAKGVDAAKAEEIFDLVDKFAGYGFNKSHAAAYAYITYQTAWLKTHAPVEFFAASMSLDISNTDRLAVFYQDARRSSVTIRPPDVNRSDADFAVADGEVLYALGAVRNVGLAAMQHLVAVRQQDGPFRDLFDFLERIDPRQIGKRALENLAKAGAFDAIHPHRAQILAAADDLIAYAQSMAAERAAAQANLFGGEHADAARPRLPTTAPFAAAQQLDEELAAIGFYLSGHPLDDLAAALRRRRTTFCAEALAQARSGVEAFRMAGVVRRRQERTSAGTNQKFAFVTLSDPSGEYEVLFASEALRRHRDLLEPGAQLLIKVRAKTTDGDVRFFGDDAEVLDRTTEAAPALLRVHVSPGAADPAALRQRLKPTPAGGGDVMLVASFSGGREAEFRLPGRYVLDAAARGALKTAPGVTFLEDA
ncbi:MAG TPA: DNA polymerase III subunit alpha [Caulobacteraceae bacterium]|nr:DNA polymerase III subunit alpha [Caulobacteraceae bacterium]